jgi:hypothetical protein
MKFAHFISRLTTLMGNIRETGSSVRDIEVVVDIYNEDKTVWMNLVPTQTLQIEFVAYDKNEKKVRIGAILAKNKQ